MKTWKRASTSFACGAELGCLIRPEAAYLEIELPNGVRKVRCEKHAGCPAPDRIEGDESPRQASPPPFTSTRALAARFDYKWAQANDK